MFSKTSKYEADIDDSVVSLISSSLGYMELTYELNRSLLIDRTSSIYLNVWLKDTASFCYYPVTVSEQKLPHMNIRINPLTKGHNWCLLECQRVVGRPGLQRLHRYCLQESQSIPLISASEYLYGLSE